MNGFTNAILSLLLSWIRVIINQFWNLLNSETGEQLVSFLAKNWKILLVILCAGGLLLDLIIFFFRWRPDFVWKNRRRKQQKQWDEEEQTTESESTYQWENDPYPDENAVQRRSRTAGYATAGYKPVRGVRAIDVETQQISPYLPPQPQQQTISYEDYTRAYQRKTPLPDFEPVFDEDVPGSWAEGDTLVASAVAKPSPSYQTYPFPQPKTASYLRDMQAGYAPPIPPEQMYAPQLTESEPSAPVHPGLDPDSIRKNMGLNPAGSLPETEDAQEEVIAINTSPLAETSGNSRSKTLFSTLARIMGSGEEDKRTIYDLQPPVDMQSGFREPAYPKMLPNKEDDSSSNF